MKKQFTLTLFILFALWSTNQVTAQQLNADRAPGRNLTSVSPSSAHSSSLRNGNPGNQTQAIFDVQFNYPLSFASGVSCVYTGSEFWVGRWNNDSIYTLDPGGVITAGFKIAGVGTTGSGVRALTYDGTYIYASDNTTTIKKIDPATKTLLGTITAPAAVRGLAYDSTANGNTGGFWISNFNADFVLISMSGVTLETITVGEYNAASVYGIAFDPYTSGGPYIWAFSQGTAGDSAKIHRINVPTHTNTGLIHNAWSDVAANTAIAGSLSITWRFDPNHYTLMGCTQDSTNHLFGYELADYTPPSVDVICNSIDFYPPYTQLPTFETSPMTWEVNLTNSGSNPITDLATSFVFDDGTTSVFSPAAFHSFGVAPGASPIANFGNYTPPSVPQAYNGTAIANTTGQTDQDTTNNTITYSMAVTDTVMARDNGIPTGALGLPGGFSGVLGQVFEIPVTCGVTSATFFLRNPDIGDTVSADLYSYSSLPDVVIASTPIYVITAADTNGVEITLPFIGAPFQINPGIYFLGVNQFETDSNISLGTSGFNWRQDAAYFQFTGGAWQTVESNVSPFIICYILRLNMMNPDDQIAEIGNRKFRVYPNPASSNLVIESLQSNSDFSVELYDMIGNKVMEAASTAASRTTLDVSQLAKGMYVAKMIANGNSTSIKISVN
jgi:hypothetical protein